MIIFLVGHGETTGDVEDRYGGDYDDHLTNKGVDESRELAKKLSDRNVEVVYSSPKARAVETATVLGNALNAPLKIVPDLRERNNYGVLTGLTKTEAKQNYPEEVKELESGIRHKVKESEGYDSFKERVIGAFDRVVSENQRVLVIVSHAGPIRCIVKEILKAGEIKSLGDCAVITLEKNDGEFRIASQEGVNL